MTGKLTQLKSDAKRERWHQWIRSEADERAVLEGCKFSRQAGQHVVDFFAKFLRHSLDPWAGQPFELLDWEIDGVVMPLFGWMRADGSRRFRKAGIWVAKKNGKSTLATGLALYMLVGDREAGPRVFIAAADRDQAGIVYGEAERMVQASPALQSRLTVTPSRKTIGYVAQNGILQALSAEVRKQHGWNWNALIFDELHAQRTRDMWDTLVYGGAARRQPLLIAISTAGFDELTIGYEQYEYAKKVANGDITDTTFLPYIREAEAKDDWTAKATWYKANPSLGVVIREEELAEVVREAQNSPIKENTVRRLRLNQWTKQDVLWLNMDAWNACDGEVDAEELAGQPCCGGLDLAKTQDMTAFVLVFPQKDDYYALLPFFFLPADNILDLEKKDAVPYRFWAEQGYLTLTPGPVVDYGVIKAKIRECDKKYDLQKVPYDPHEAETLAQELLNDDGVQMIEHGQGFNRMSEPSKDFERLMLAGRLRHNGHPILRWHASNAAVRIGEHGDYKPIKADQKGSQRKKVDGIIAAIMGVGWAQRIELEAAAASVVWLN